MLKEADVCRISAKVCRRKTCFGKSEKYFSAKYSRFVIRFADSVCREVVLDVNQELAEASAKWDHGDSQGALLHYEKVLEADPSNPLANNGLGVALLAAGKPEASLNFFAKAIAGDEFQDGFWINLLSAQIAAKKYPEARALVRVPKLGAHAELAKKLKDRLRKEEFLYGSQICGSSDFESLEYCRSLVVQYPNFPESWNIQGSAELASGFAAKAAKSLERSIALGLVNASTLNNLGVALREIGSPLAAIDRFKEALGLDPDFLDAKSNQALLLAEIGDYDPAITLIDDVLKIDLGRADLVAAKGACLMQLGRVDDGIKSLEASLDGTGVVSKHSSQLAWMYQANGDFAKSERLLFDVLASDPKNARAYFSYRQLVETTHKDQLFLGVEELLGEEGLSPSDRILLEFSQAKVCKDLQEYDGFYRRLVSANALKRKQVTYSLSPLRADFERIQEIFSRSSNGGRSGGVPLQKTRPIFIVGLPRTGSTLIERVLSAHSEVKALGETEQIPKIMRAYNLRPVGSLTEIVSALRALYEQRLEAYGVNRAFATDKTLANFFYLGFLLEAFPAGVAVEVVRSRKASALSLYERLFDEGACEFSYSLDDLDDYFRFYDEVMDFWKSVFPDRIKTLEYEKFTEDQKQQTWDLLDHCGLGHQAQCLEFSSQKGSIQTASFMQARRPIYRGASNAWLKVDGFVAAAEGRFNK